MVGKLFLFLKLEMNFKNKNNPQNGRKCRISIKFWKKTSFVLKDGNEF
jgi:hypothetical protein